jgi:hypothetical protein
MPRLNFKFTVGRCQGQVFRNDLSSAFFPTMHSRRTATDQRKTAASAHQMRAPWASHGQPQADVSPGDGCARADCPRCEDVAASSTGSGPDASPVHLIAAVVGRAQNSRRFHIAMGATGTSCGPIAARHHDPPKKIPNQSAQCHWSTPAF